MKRFIKQAGAIVLLLLLISAATAATDGVYTKTVPDYTGMDGLTVDESFDEMKENFAWGERFYLCDENPVYDGYSVHYSYTSGNITGITVKDGGDVTKASIVLTYSGGNLSTTACTVNGKILTTTFYYSGGSLDYKSYAITTP